MDPQAKSDASSGIPLSPSSIYLHWIVGLGIISLITTGMVMEHYEIYPLFDWHKALGLLLIPFILWRIILRLKLGWPEKPVSSPRLHIISLMVHGALLLATILFPFSGIIMSIAGGHGLELGPWALISPSPSLSNPHAMEPLSKSWSIIGEALHSGLIFGVIPLILLHVVAALKHHFIDKDTLLKRMMGS